MRQLLNTLFVTSEDIYLSLDGENVVANRGGEPVARYPLHTLQSIVTFSYAGASPALMGKCAQREIGLAFCSQRGKFLARVSGQMQGNVLLRRMQYRVADDPSQSCRIARNMIFGKVYNARWSVERTRRDHAPRVDGQRFSAVSQQLQGLLPQIAAETSPDSLRGLEGIGAAAYFSVFVGWPWPHFFTGDQCAKIDLHGETGNCHLLLQMPVFRFVQTEKNRDRSFSDNRFLLEIGWGLRGLAPLTSAFG